MNPELSFSDDSTMPLFPLSAERVNATRQSPQRSLKFESPPNRPTTPIMMSSDRTRSPFGHPEYGIPGDFSGAALAAQTRGRLVFGESPFKQTDIFGNPTRTTQSNSPPKVLHVRTNSDVQGMVARFNSLDIKDHADLRKKEAAALKRAQMARDDAQAQFEAEKVAREELEEEFAKQREECRALRKNAEEGKQRELKVSKRLEALMDDLHRAKETQLQTHQICEREVRKSKKEAFKASSVVVKLQEELRSTRTTMKVLQADLEMERMKINQKEQETFTAQYQIVGVQEELVKAKQEKRVVEEERDALKASLQSEEVARIAAEGRIALPLTTEDDEFGSPRKVRTPQHRQQSSPIKPSAIAERQIEDMKAELELERRRRQDAEDNIHFLQMECQFGCCACRTANQHSVHFVQDGSFDAEVRHIKDFVASILTPPASTNGETTAMEVDQVPDSRVIVHSAPPLTPPTSQPQEPKEPISSFEPSRGRKLTRTTPIALVPVLTQHAPMKMHITEESVMLNHTTQVAARSPETPTIPEHSTPIELAVSPETYTPPNEPMPNTPHSQFRIVTTTTTVPLAPVSPEKPIIHPATPASHPAHFPSRSRTPLVASAPAHTSFESSQTCAARDEAKPDFSAFMGDVNLTREEAIEQLRQRRGRARSTARAASGDAVSTKKSDTPRRDISAPEMTHTAGRTPKRVR